jgi:hypothetical protein
MRPHARWLATGAWWLLVAVSASWVSHAAARRALAAISEISTPRSAGGLARDALDALLAGTLALFGLALTVAVVVAWLSGGAGPVRAAARRRLGPTEPTHGRRTGGAMSVLAVVAALVCGLALSGVLAGAARAPASSEAGLVALWHAWAVRGAAVVGVIALSVGMLERWLRARAITAALHRTVAEARTDVRAGGGARR